MSDGHRLAQLMREAGKTPQNEVVDIVTGQVTSVSPIKVKVENRELTQSFLIVGALCKETTNYGIKLWRGLEIGDKVLMLKVGRGQKYYVLQREEGVSST